MAGMNAIANALAQVGPRLKRIRTQRNITLAALAESTGISKSTLSRLEAGQRKPSLELLLPIAQAHQVPLDELIEAPATGDPRVRVKPLTAHGRTYVPLTQQPGAMQAYKVLIPADAEQAEPEMRVHEGYEWFYVLAGKVRLVLAEYDIVLGPGEAAEFDTRLPHWFGPAGDQPVEILSLFGRQGERIHVRAAPRSRKAD